jgi:hypothetical protein
MSVGIHFTNEQWHAPGHQILHRLKLSQPDTIKTCLFTEVGYDQIQVHRQLRQDFPNALIVVRLFASMGGGHWPARDFANAFSRQIEALKGTVQWFEVHNEPNHRRDFEGFGDKPEDFEEFKTWALEVLLLLKAKHPWAKWVFPGQLVDGGPHEEFWKANLEAIRQFDAWGVHCYWQGNNHRSPKWGRCYEVAHGLLPNLPIIITEFGDSTDNRSVAEKVPFYREWYKDASKQSYIMGTAVFILGGTPDWVIFEVNDEMAQAIGQIPRRDSESAEAARASEPAPLPVQPPRELAPGEVSNQDIISSFHDIALRLGLGKWDLLGRAGLSLGDLAKARQEAYSGPKIDQMTRLSAEQRTLVKGDLVRRAGLSDPDQAVNFGPGQSVGAGWLVKRPELMGTPLDPSRELRIAVGQAQAGIEMRVARAWNRYGMLLLSIADALHIDPAAVVAVVANESDRRGVAGDGRLLIRFEPQVFYDKWGKENKEAFDRCFKFDPNRPEQGHRWRPSADAAWREPHKNQASEWEAFTLARTLNEWAAKLSIRMGLVEMMGFNYALLGYQTVDGMFGAFAASERYQLFALFDLIAGEFNDNPQLMALQDQDFDAFAALNYGGRQAARYAITMRAAFEAFQRLSPVD